MENNEEKNVVFEDMDIEYKLEEEQTEEQTEGEPPMPKETQASSPKKSEVFFGEIDKNESEIDLHSDKTNEDEVIIEKEKEKTSEVQIFSINDIIFSQEEKDLLQKYFYSVKPEEKIFDFNKVNFKDKKELEQFEEISKYVLSLYYTLKYLKETSLVITKNEIPFSKSHKTAIHRRSLVKTKNVTPSDNRKILLNFLKNKVIGLTNDKIIFILKELYYSKDIENDDTIRKKILSHFDKKQLDEILETNFKERTILFQVISKFAKKILDIQDATKNENVSLLESKNNEIEYLQRELDKTHSLCSEKENEIEELKYKIEEMQLIISKNEKNINEDDYQKQKDMIDSLNSKINELEDAKKSAQNMIDSLNSKINELEAERDEVLKDKESSNKDLLKQIDEKNRKIEELNFEIEELIKTQKESVVLEQQNEKIDIAEKTEKQQENKKDEDSENLKSKINFKKILIYGSGGLLGLIILIIVWISFASTTETQNNATRHSMVAVPVKKQDAFSTENSTKLTPEVFNSKSTQSDNDRNKMKVKSIDFVSEKTKDEMREYNYDIYTDNPLIVRINNRKFKSMDVINGWEFIKTVPSFGRIYFAKTGTDGTEMLVIKMK